MARFIIEATHTKEDCVEALDSVMAFSESLLGRMDWGCGADRHVGWLTVEAQDEATARMMLPTNIRTAAKVTRLNKFTIDEVKSFHEGGH